MLISLSTRKVKNALVLEGMSVGYFYRFNMNLADQKTEQPPRASLEKLLTLCAPSMAQVNDIITVRMASDVPLIPELASHLIAAGGKRMRPMLCVVGALAASKGQSAPASVLQLAAAVEFIHSATLLHDDVIDKSDRRRGRDTANALWGNEASVLVGDFLFARAFELMVETNDLAVLGLLSSASARITEGEVKQMTMAGAPDSSLDDYFSMIANKTATLFSAAAESGARVAGADEALSKAMHQYGLHLGMAFQICDDALDYEADPAYLGKNGGDDFHEGKITLPVILAWQEADNVQRAFWKRTLGDNIIQDGDLDKARALLAHHKAIENALSYARAETECAIQALSVIPDGPVKAALHEAALFAGKRAY